MSEKPLSHPKATKIYSLFSSKSSVILAYIFRSLIYFNLIFLYIHLFILWDRCPASFFCIWIYSCSSTIWKDYYFPTGWSWHLYQKSVIKNTYVYLWLFHVDVWQKSSQYCKVIFLQLKLKLKSMTINVKVYFWTLNSIPLICVFILMPALITVALQY